MTMSSVVQHRVGLQAKLKAMEYFVSKGYYIFDETNQGPVDFIAMNMEGDVQFIECKSLAKRSDGSKIHRILSSKQKELNKNLEKNNYPKIKIFYSDIGECNDS